MKKRLTLIVLFIASVIFISNFFKSTDKKLLNDKNTISNLREKHSNYLKNSPFKKTLKLSKKERKALGIPPNKYFEREWELTMNPATGKPEPHKVLNLQKNRNQKSKSLAARNPGDAVSNSWEERGPNNVGGRTRVVLFDPNDISNKRVFAGGVSGGLWVNEDITNSNSSWTLVSDVPSNMNISCITVDPRDSNIWYLGTGEQYTAGAAVGNGVYKTINGGVTWTHVNVSLAGGETVGTDFAGLYYINDIIAWDNGGSTEVFIGVGTNLYGDASPDNWLGFQNAGLYKSIDNGSNWSRIESSNLKLTSGSSYYTIPNDFEISANNTLWMGTIRTPGTSNGGGKIFSSLDGLTWTEAAGSPLANSNRVEIAVSSTDPLKMYALTQGTTTAGPNIFASSDAFANTTTLSKPDDADTDIDASDFARGQAFYNLVIEVDPIDDNIVYVGGIDLFRTDQGINTNLTSDWKQISKWSNNNNLASLNCSYMHADQHALTFRPGNNNEAVIGCDGGVYYANSLSTAENNNVISERNKNYNVTQFYYGGYGQSTTNELIVAGAQDNGSQFINGAISGENPGTLVSTGDGAYSTIDKDGDYMIVSYVYNDHTYIKLPYTGNGSNEYIIDDTGDEGDFINPAALDHNLDIMYSNGTSKINRYALGISSSTKVQLTNALLTGNPTAFKVSPFTTTSTTLLVGTDDGKLLKLTNAHHNNTNNINWLDITGGSFVGSISSIEFGENENEIFVTFHNYGITSIWFTSNGGVDWWNKEGDLPDMPVKCILQNPLAPNEVIIGTELGVWATSNFDITPNSTPNWVSSFNGMRDVKVVDLDLRTSDNSILATTFGRGLFTGKFSNTEFSISTDNSKVTTCSNTAIFNFDFNTNAQYNTQTFFSTTGEPAGVTISFNPTSLSTAGAFSMTVDNVNSLSVGEYPITVIGTGNQSNSIDVILKVDDNSIGIVNTLTPLNGATNIENLNTNFTWDIDPEATTYDFDISTDAGFNTIIETKNVITNSYTTSLTLSSSTVYYWRVRSKNDCIAGDYSETKNFQTKTITCNTLINNSQTPIPDGIAANTAGTPAESIINFPSSLTISDVNLTINITHPYIGDLVISLIAPDNTEITLFNRECNDDRYQNISVTYDDNGLATINCINSAISEIVKPSSPLNGFNGLNSLGDWTLKVVDYYNNDFGTLNNWSLEICESQTVINSTFSKADPIIVSANSTQIIRQIEMEASGGGTPSEQFYMLTELPVKGNLKLNGSILNLGDSFTQADINSGLLSFENSITINDTDQFKVDITNASSGILSNQQVNLSIDASTLSVDNHFFEKTDTKIFPTISKGEFSIISNTHLGNTYVEIFNLNGQMVYHEQIDLNSGSIKKITANGLASGIYIIKLTSDSSQGSKKIIIK